MLFGSCVTRLSKVPQPFAFAQSSRYETAFPAAGSMWALERRRPPPLNTHSVALPLAPPRGNSLTTKAVKVATAWILGRDVLYPQAILIGNTTTICVRTNIIHPFYIKGLRFESWLERRPKRKTTSLWGLIAMWLALDRE